ncbi:MAG: MFS transporter [Methanobacterium sp.]|nr:MFS transporter [Methanobacterium sp.]
MQYKWTALSIILISSLMGSINMSITLIALPAIFNGIQIDPMNSFQYLLWILMVFGLVNATLLLSFGRLSDIYGRAKFFKLGFLIFTIGSVLLYLTPSTGDAGAIEIIIFRIIQAIGAAFTMANGAAIIADAFHHSERGKALGINMVMWTAGQFIGLIIGGILAVFNWRYVFLVSVPFGIIGTVWSILSLKEISIRSGENKIDILGNITFVASITSILIGISYGLMPYGSDSMGWNNPWVIFALVLGMVLMPIFLFIESRVEVPMFNLKLFRIKMFSFANLAGLCSSLARGGMMFMLIILLQGIWLPLHGYSYESTPFWAGIYILPFTLGLAIMGPTSGHMSDKYGPRWIATGGMIIITLSFLALASLPYNFEYWVFAMAIFAMGLGYGMFSSPNSASIMNSVPVQERGVASGMQYTIMNTAFTVSMGIFFTIVIVGISQRFPTELASSLSSVGASYLTPLFNQIPPTGALFSAFLGYNPVGTMLQSLPPKIVAMIPPQTLSTLTGTTWFPQTIANAFMPSLQITFYIGAVLSAIAAIFSALRGEKFIHESHHEELDEEV